MRGTKKPLLALAAVSLASLVAGCNSNGNSVSPPTTQADLTQYKLQMAVGTMYDATDNTTGLNVVTTFRQSNGNSAVLADQPTLTGPTGFVIPASAPGAYTNSHGANVDAGKNTISGSPQVPLNNQGLINSTLGTFTGVFSYGFGPFNSSVYTGSGSASAYLPGNPNNAPGNGFQDSTYDGTGMVAAAQGSGDATQPLPFFSSSGTAFDYIGGPPAYPFFADGTQANLFAGYSQGFYAFEVPPVAGTYSLSVLVPATNAAQQTYTANAALATTAPLGAVTVAGITEAPTGGLSGTVAVPAGATETMVYAVDVTTNMYYSVEVTGGAGTTQNWSIPGNLGACTGTGCQNSSPTPSFNTGDSYMVTAVSADYPLFEASPPNNTSATPTIAGANGQADISLGTITSATY